MPGAQKYSTYILPVAENELLKVAQSLFVKLSLWQSHSKWKLKQDFILLLMEAFSCESLGCLSAWTIDVLPYFIMINELMCKQRILKICSDTKEICLDSCEIENLGLQNRLQTSTISCIKIEAVYP